MGAVPPESSVHSPRAFGVADSFARRLARAGRRNLFGDHDRTLSSAPRQPFRTTPGIRAKGGDAVPRLHHRRQGLDIEKLAIDAAQAASTNVATERKKTDAQMATLVRSAGSAACSRFDPAHKA